MDVTFSSHTPVDELPKSAAAVRVNRPINIIMKDNNNPPRTRRSVLKMIGSTASAAGMAGVASAKEQQVGRLERWRVLRSNKVQQIYEEVNRPTIRSTKKIKGNVAETDGTVYRFQTDIGELRHISYDGHTVAQFIFTMVQQQVTNKFNKLKQKYGKIFQVPATIYTNEEGDTAYIREVTKHERSELATATGVDHTDAAIAYSSEVGGFVVKQTSKDSPPEIMVVTPQDGISRLSTESSLAHGNVERRDISTLGCDELACFDCALAAFTGVFTCIGACATSAVTGIAGIVLCIGCIIAAGIIVSVPCYRCYKSCK